MDCLGHLFALLDQLTTTSADLSPCDILCLGSGWTYTFLGPAAADAGLKIAFTSRDAKSGAVPFTFDPESDDVEPFRVLPDAKAVVIIFPLYSKLAVKRLVGGYLKTRQGGLEGGNQQTTTPRFLLLGSTGIWDHGPTLQFAPLTDGISRFQDEKGPSTRSSSAVWKDRHSEVLPVPRAQAEDALLALNQEGNVLRKARIPTSVLCLSGLWGHGRSPRRYITLIAPTKEKLKGLGSVHFIHGHDVARSILAMLGQWEKTESPQRWLLTNERVYDMWDLCSRWGSGGDAGRDHAPVGPQPKWVQELIADSRSPHKGQDLKHGLTKHAIRSLPRTVEQMGHGLDGTDFWLTFGLSPEVPWVD